MEKISRMLKTELPGNPFYRRKLLDRGFTTADSPAEFSKFPYTIKSELVADQQAKPPFGTALSFPVERYTRVHQTSGTTGKPMYWLDAEESWQWWGECWKTIFEAAGVKPGDRIYFAFSFGPFIGFWSAWEGARTLGALAISGGAQTTVQRIKAIVDYQATVLVCTPTYALHMAAEAQKAGIDLAQSVPTETSSPITTPGASMVRAPTRLRAPMIAPGATRTPFSRIAVGSIIADGWIPGATGGAGGWKRTTARTNEA